MTSTSVSHIALLTLAVMLTVAERGAVAAGQSTTHPVVQAPVYVAGEDGYHTYRIPSVIATPGGALLAFAEGRRAGRGDAGDIDLVLKRSDDQGRTWSRMVVIGDNGPHTFGNPCPVVDRSTGSIWLFTTHNGGSDHERDIIDGTAQGSRTVWLMQSTDDGRTWSTPVEVTAQTKRADWTWYATGPGIGIQTASGRLVVPANHAVAGSKVHRSHVLLSDDHGATWRIGGIAEDGTNESQVAEASDGQLLLNMRNHPPRAENYRRVAVSRDGGETFGPSTEDRALPEPPAQASLLRVAGVAAGNRGRLVFANPSGAGRVRLTVRLSDDDGRSWPVHRVLHEGPAAYSSLVSLPGDRIGVLYERGDGTPYETITFARIPLAWLTGQD